MGKNSEFEVGDVVRVGNGKVDYRVFSACWSPVFGAMRYGIVKTTSKTEPKRYIRYSGDKLRAVRS